MHKSLVSRGIFGRTVQTKSIAILDQLLANVRELESRNKTREKRQTQLLRAHDEADSEWFMYLDSRFNTALDIAKTARIEEDEVRATWTQGSTFSFSVGDTIYDQKKGYGPWVIGNIRRCIQVTLAIPVTPASRDEADKPITKRLPGHVAFVVLEPNFEGTALVDRFTSSMTQDDFVRMLIRGFEAAWSST